MEVSFLIRLSNFVLPLINFKKKSDNRKNRIMKMKVDRKYKLPFLMKFIYKFKKDTFESIDLYTFNNNSKSNKIIIYLHGGSYIYNPTIIHFNFLNDISKKTDYKIIVPIYKKLPNYNFTDNKEVLINLYNKLSCNNKIILMGDSAGGGLALSLSLEIKKLKLVDPSKLILISPWMDFELKNEDIKNYINDDLILNIDSLQAIGKLWMNGDTSINPITHKFSNLYIFTGSNEIFLPDILEYKNKQKNTFIDVYKGMPHNYLLLPIKEAKEKRFELLDIINN